MKANPLTKSSFRTVCLTPRIFRAVSANEIVVSSLKLLKLPKNLCNYLRIFRIKVKSKEYLKLL